MDSISEFVSQGAQVMATERGDVWTVDDAEETLYNWMTSIVADNLKSISSGGFQLSRHEEDGVVEWDLQRKKLTYHDFADEPEGNFIFDWK